MRDYNKASNFEKSAREGNWKNAMSHLQSSHKYNVNRHDGIISMSNTKYVYFNQSILQTPSQRSCPSRGIPFHPVKTSDCMP